MRLKKVHLSTSMHYRVDNHNMYVVASYLTQNITWPPCIWKGATSHRERKRDNFRPQTCHFHYTSRCIYIAGMPWNKRSEAERGYCRVSICNSSWCRWSSDSARVETHFDGIWLSRELQRRPILPSALCFREKRPSRGVSGGSIMARFISGDFAKAGWNCIWCHLFSLLAVRSHSYLLGGIRGTICTQRKLHDSPSHTLIVLRLRAQCKSYGAQTPKLCRCWFSWFAKSRFILRVQRMPRDF